MKYIRAIPYHHEIRVCAKLTDWENYMRVEYIIYDAKDGTRMSKGYTRQVAVSMQTKEMCLASPVFLKKKLERYFVD